MKRINYLTTSIAILMVLIFSQCIPGMKYINGNGNLIEEKREVPLFDEIDVRGSFEVYVYQSDSTAMYINCESNLMPYIETYVSDRELIVKTPFQFNINPSFPVQLAIYTPDVEKVKLSGSGLIDTDTIYSDELVLRVSGSGDIRSVFYGNDFDSKVSGSGDMILDVYADDTELAISGSGDIDILGKTRNCEIDISGSGKIKASEFEIENADVAVSGSGNMWLWVTDYLHARISGSGNIYLTGTPEIDYKNSGSGELYQD